MYMKLRGYIRNKCRQSIGLARYTVKVIFTTLVVLAVYDLWSLVLVG
jgi:hypothetical protein